MINNRMRENSREEKINWFTQLLGAGTVFCASYLDDDEVAAITCVDLIDFLTTSSMLFNILSG